MYCTCMHGFWSEYKYITFMVLVEEYFHLLSLWWFSTILEKDNKITKQNHTRGGGKLLLKVTTSRHFLFHPKFRKFWFEIKMKWTINGSVWLEYLQPFIKMVHFDQSVHFGQLDWNIPFHFPKLLSTVQLFYILLPKSYDKTTCAVT